jgi:hypothetical protein
MVNVPNGNLPAGDLARAITHELNDSWPVSIEIVAYFGENKRKRKAVTISADEFFGRGGYGAPMSGDQIIGIIHRLRLQR